MGVKRPVAPETPVRSFPTPNIEDSMVVVDIDSRLPGYQPLEYGTLHPDQTTFPGAKLVYQEPLEGADRFVRRIYATDRSRQDTYNYAIKFSGGSPEHPVYIRTYVEPREGYEPLPDGSKDPVFPDAMIVDEEVAPVEGELSSLYFRVTRVFETLPGPVITSFDTNEAGQKVTITTQRKSADGYVLPAATALSTPSAQSEDTGVVVEQIRTVPSLFSRRQFSAERPDMLPQKFRAAVPDVEVSELVAGTAEQPVLGQGDISASETQQSLFIKQVSRRSRTSPSYPRVIVETAATRSGQVATVTSTLDDGPQTADSGPLIEASEVTDLGDGRTIKVTTEVDEIFADAAYTRAKEDLTPAKFRAAVSETVVEQTVAGQAAMPVSLGPDEISKSEQQVTTNRKRTRIQNRTTATTATLSGELFTTDLGGGVATVSEAYGTNPTITPGFGTVAAEKEALGDGKFATRHVVLSNPPTLTGQVYDEALDIVVPFTQKVVPSTTPVGSNRISVDPRDIYHSVQRQLDVADYRTKALQEHWQVASYVNMELPDQLTGVEAVFSRSISGGSAVGAGLSWSVRASGTAAATVDIRFQMRNGYTGPVPATRHVFFLDKNAADFGSVAAKTGATAFPQLFPEPVTFTCVSGSVTKEVSSSASLDLSSGGASTGSGTSFGTSLSSTITTIPPSLHGTLTVGVVNLTIGNYTPGSNPSTFSITGIASSDIIDAPGHNFTNGQAIRFTNLNGGLGLTTSATYFVREVSGSSFKVAATSGGPAVEFSTDITSGTVSTSQNVSVDQALTFNPEFWPKTIPATSPASFPPGNYLVSIDTESFKYGLVRVTAVVAHVSSSYVS